MLANYGQGLREDGQVGRMSRGPLFEVAQRQEMAQAEAQIKAASPQAAPRLL
jgi:hypothetical protein